MIGYINGIIQAISGKYAIVDVNGVGYRVTMPAKNLNSIAKIGAQVKLFTHYQTNPRDGSVELYGFTTPEELNFFELLTTVSGIGPKSAQAILASADLQMLQIGIIRGDGDYLHKVSGIGEKTAHRLVLELKNKIMTADVGALADSDVGTDSDAIDALMTLGYSQYQARDVLKQVAKTAKTSEEKIKEALKLLGGKK
ncbi:MAG: Holliday junction branch migration protein RuvA [Candidatus Yanofskybacteria bacterium]|nr:Holliday junction branch migration protein RuvA [Candidatus Yanofskybacteria bacterium]